MQDKSIIPVGLAKQIKQNNIILFVGAGISINAGFPSWKDLIIKILNKLEKEPKADVYIEALKGDAFSPIDILGKLESLKTDIIKIFESEIRNVIPCPNSAFYMKMSQISSKIITTNYDTILETSLPNFEKIVYTYDFKVSKLSEYQEYIFKIHGDINEPDKCILFPSQYEELYSTNEKSSIFELKKLFSNHTFLFLGFSLSDPYINYILKYINQLYSGFNPEHYIITTDKDNKWGDNITPIIIDNYTDIELIFDSILLNKNIDKKVDSAYTSNTVEHIVLSELEYDTPPDIKYWVGREKMLENISNENFKVVCITGIGGQGKSALAAFFVKNKFDSQLYEFADWRDFKEETYRFQTKMISILKRLEGTKFNVKSVEELDNKELVDLFFMLLGNRKIIFVFDNIDHYIDLEHFLPSGEMAYLFNAALNQNHFSKFIFTCRPFIKEAGPTFYQIQLPGLTSDETIQLFYKYYLPEKKDEIAYFAEKAHSATKGHPLWLNLIAAQACRSMNTANTFMENIGNTSFFDEENFSAILSQKVLSHIWETLNRKQQILLCGIAETVRPETVDNLKKILGSELNNNQFEKAFKVLKGLNLIEFKTSSISKDLVELHPLVKEFILSKYQRNERSKFISLLVKFYENFIIVLKPKLGNKLSLYDYSYWTTNIELQINNGDYVSALASLSEVSSSIATAGYIEEYLRVTEKLYNSIEWFDANNKEIPYFHKELQSMIRIMIQFGIYDKSKEFLDKYSKLITNKNDKYLALCGLRCYYYWFKGNFEAAIDCGEEGEYLINNSKFSNNAEVLHYLGLSRRDSRVDKNIELALKYFLHNEDINKVTDLSEPVSFSGEFYGNIGKCLEFKGDVQNALICYFKSLSALLSKIDTDDTMNVGYACSWIANIYLVNNQVDYALHFLRYAIVLRETISPPKAKIDKETWELIKCDDMQKNIINAKDRWQIEKYCQDIMKQFFETGD
jgi:tetratricopeptide (TPR) repeat protein